VNYKSNYEYRNEKPRLTARLFAFGELQVPQLDRTAHPVFFGAISSTD
jgi:hypothetical protein